jgi:hypothetical protein
MRWYNASEVAIRDTTNIDTPIPRLMTLLLDHRVPFTIPPAMYIEESIAMAATRTLLRHGQSALAALSSATGSPNPDLRSVAIGAMYNFTGYQMAEKSIYCHMRPSYRVIPMSMYA